MKYRISASVFEQNNVLDGLLEATFQILSPQCSNYVSTTTFRLLATVLKDNLCCRGPQEHWDLHSNQRHSRNQQVLEGRISSDVVRREFTAHKLL